jgi:hypothetical protein
MNFLEKDFRKMKKHHFVTINLIAVMLISACAVLAVPASTSTPPPTIPPAPTVTPTMPPQPTAALSQEVINDHLDSQNNLSGYTIEVVYPRLTGDDAVSQEFNQSSKDLVEHVIEYFKKDLEDMGELPPDMVSHESWLQIDYEITYAEQDLISVLFGISIYYAGAAHPGHFTEALNFDLVDGTIAGLSEQFKPGTDYLLFLSDYCLEDLQKQGVLEWDDGALPKPENYRVWNISADGMVITFDPYTVAPYAAGMQKVVIPFEKMVEVLNPEGLLARVQ